MPPWKIHSYHGKTWWLMPSEACWFRWDEHPMNAGCRPSSTTPLALWAYGMLLSRCWWRLRMLSWDDVILKLLLRRLPKRSMIGCNYFPSLIESRGGSFDVFFADQIFIGCYCFSKQESHRLPSPSNYYSYWSIGTKEAATINFIDVGIIQITAIVHAGFLKRTYKLAQGPSSL